MHEHTESITDQFDQRRERGCAALRTSRYFIRHCRCHVSGMDVWGAYTCTSHVYAHTCMLTCVGGQKYHQHYWSQMLWHHTQVLVSLRILYLQTQDVGEQARSVLVQVRVHIIVLFM